MPGHLVSGLWLNSTEINWRTMSFNFSFILNLNQVGTQSDFASLTLFHLLSPHTCILALFPLVKLGKIRVHPYLQVFVAATSVTVSDKHTHSPEKLKIPWGSMGWSREWEVVIENVFLLLPCGMCWRLVMTLGQNLMFALHCCCCCCCCELELWYKFNLLSCDLPLNFSSYHFSELLIVSLFHFLYVRKAY